MTRTTEKHPWIFVRHNPLVPAALLFLAGMTWGVYVPLPVSAVVLAVVTMFTAWVTAEVCVTTKLRAWIAHGCLGAALICLGNAVWQLNQRQVENIHIARFAPSAGELPVTLDARVVAPPAVTAGRHGNAYFTAEVTRILTEQGWFDCVGVAQVKWRTSATSAELAEGDAITLFGWLSRPPGALNPGGMDMRRRLAADRIFAELRVPRSGGVIITEHSIEHTNGTLSAMRSFLRNKLLQHTVNVDADAANTMVALLLGQRDASIDDVSRAFADAGVAHLLAISGAHIVFLAWVVWLVLRMVPMRPRWRELVCAIVVLSYVLATPCGPPVVRAAVVVVMVLVSRMMRRPPTYMNMLAAAAVCILLFRPADLLDAGFQLTFVCTAALLLLGERGHEALFARRLRLEEFIADLADTRWARFKLWLRKLVCGAMTANLIGTVASIPLVLFHFEQVTAYGVLTGLIAFPIVATILIMSLVQLVLELMWSVAAAAFSMVSATLAHWMVWVVTHLSEIPGAAIAMRAPPVWVIAVLYVPFVLWIARRRIGLPRMIVANLGLSTLVLAGAAYAADSNRGALCLQVLSVGQGSSVVITAPDGGTVLVNAGSRDLPDIVPTAVAPVLRADGVRRMGTIVIIGLDVVHAKNVAEVVGRYRVRRVLVPPDDGTTTFARMSLEDAVAKNGAKEEVIAAGDLVMLGREARMRVLWPGNGNAPGASSILMVEYTGRRILLMDPGNLAGLAMLINGGEDLRCDAVILFGPDRGRSDAELLERLKRTGAETIVFSGKSPWSSIGSSPGTLNTADGTVTVRVDRRGVMTVAR